MRGVGGRRGGGAGGGTATATAAAVSRELWPSGGTSSPSCPGSKYPMRGISHFDILKRGSVFSASIGFRPIGFRPRLFSASRFSVRGFRPIGFRPICFRPIGFRPMGFRPICFRPIGFRPNGFGLEHSDPESLSEDVGPGKRYKAQSETSLRDLQTKIK